jgi:SAM-dependent methyltransferase
LTAGPRAANDRAVPPYRLLYRLGIVPWERRDVEGAWGAILGGSRPPAPGRTLDVGCGSGRDAVHLSHLGFQVTGVDMVGTALDRARERARREDVEVRWVQGDVGRLGDLGLEPGFTLLYDFGCIQGLPAEAAAGAAAGLTRLAAPGATLLIMAFRRARRVVLPRGMDAADVQRLLADGWTLTGSRPEIQADMPPPVRRARPTLHTLVRLPGPDGA